jgi:hypothetical protein
VTEPLAGQIYRSEATARAEEAFYGTLKAGGDLSQDPPELPLPTSVRIGPHVYTIREMSEVDYLKSGFMGSHLASQLEIEIYPKQPFRVKGEVLLHEILHGCYFMAGLRHDGPPNEERTVDGLGLQLFGVLRDNPDVLAYIVAASKAQP